MSAPFVLIRSALPGMIWPAITRPEHAVALALQYQLERSQWLPAEELRELQLRQLDVLVRHAWETVPYYRERWQAAYEFGQPLTAERFGRLPLLRRGDVQGRFDALTSASVPAAHGAVVEGRTAGSTGNPVRTLKTELVGLWWRVLTLRDHLWHRRDFSGKLAAIRLGKAENEGEAQGWGPSTDMIDAVGRSATLGMRADTAAQLAWIQEQQPDYLLTYPTNLAELARLSLACGVQLPRLREVRTFGELLNPETRELCRRAWQVPLTDLYSSDEAGYMALQCPEHEHYHVQSESVLVEVLDEQGNACRAGELGRITVTTLHNFAMPLVRYDIGDFAEVGGACPCGRGLPVLRRIVGRARNMLVTAAGERVWPHISARTVVDFAPVLQYQLVQKRLDLLEARLVVAAPLTAGQEENLRRHILARLPAGLQLTFSYVSEIPRGAGGKFEDFVSEVAARS